MKTYYAAFVTRTGDVYNVNISAESLAEAERLAMSFSSRKFRFAGISN